MIYKNDVLLNDMIQYIEEFRLKGYDLEFSIDYNRELKELPNEKLYNTNEITTMDYTEFLSNIYNHFRSIERQQLYEFQVKLYHNEDNTNFHFELCALRPFQGDAGYKRGGGSGTFGMRIFLTNRKSLLNQLSNLNLPFIYEKIGIDFINEEHPFLLENIDCIVNHIKTTICKNIVGQIIEENYYKLQERYMEFNKLKELVTNNIIINQYNLNDFNIDIKEEYDNFYFEIAHKYLGKIISLTQRKEVQIDYYLDIKY